MCARREARAFERMASSVRPETTRFIEQLCDVRRRGGRIVRKADGYDLMDIAEWTSDQQADLEWHDPSARVVVLPCAHSLSGFCVCVRFEDRCDTELLFILACFSCMTALIAVCVGVWRM